MQPLFEKKSPWITPFRPPVPDKIFPRNAIRPLWKTSPLPVDFSTAFPKSFPHPVENSVDISAKIWNNPCKIRLFGDFCRVKSNFGGVDNYQTGILLSWSFPQGQRATAGKIRRFSVAFRWKNHTKKGAGLPLLFQIGKHHLRRGLRHSLQRTNQPLNDPVPVASRAFQRPVSGLGGGDRPLEQGQIGLAGLL